MDKELKLTLEDALNFVENIKGLDDEIAHIKEDELRDWFIKGCALGLYTIEEVKEIGKVVLSTNEIDFDRWYA